jgi:antitoxin component YwqK of YwqJK toxin-antitoxin module
MNEKIKDGLHTEWYENGKKKLEGTFKDGKLNGLSTTWYGDGQKKSEIHYKDGKIISQKEWNEDGSVME